MATELPTYDLALDELCISLSYVNMTAVPVFTPPAAPAPAEAPKEAPKPKEKAAKKVSYRMLFDKMCEETG